MKKYLLAAMIALPTVALAHSAYTKHDDGITVSVSRAAANQAKTVGIRVIGDKIIRVSAAATDTIPATESLVVV